MTSDHRFTVSLAQWPEHQETLITIRRSVFIDEQNVSEAEEIDGLDAQHSHVLCSDSNTRQAVGCARISSSGKIGRMAILKPYRNAGLGAAIMRFCNDMVLQRGQQPYLDAQTEAIGFYEKLGYRAQGETFMDANIPHRAMVYHQGVHPTKASATASLIKTIANSRRELYIQCPAQLGLWLSTTEITEALKQSIVRGSTSQIQILLDEKDPDYRRLMPILDLAKRLSSKVSVRCCTEQADPFSEFYLLNNKTLWRAPVSDNKSEPEHFSSLNLSPQQRDLKHESFLRRWEHLTWDNPNLRQIYL